MQLNNEMAVIETASDGQCAAQGVRVGMTIVGVNGVSLATCMTDPRDVNEFASMMHAAQRPLTLNFNALPQVVKKRYAPASTIGFFEPGPMSCMDSCCGLEVRPKSAVENFELAPMNAPLASSCFTSCCLLVSSTPPRTEGGIEKVPQLKALAGLSVQVGDHPTKNSVQTLKWSRYDPKSRVLLQSVFGGASDVGNVGTWTETDSCLWRFLVPLARSCDYLYLFKFSEDYQKLDIDVKVNCCCCVPCIPAWCSLPAFPFGKHAAYQVEGTDGKNWVRTKNGKKYYDLIVVTDSDGVQNEKYGDIMQACPSSMLVSR